LGREGLSAANNPQIAQYAPNTPRITLRIAVLLIKKAAESPFTLQALLKHAVANVLLYPHLTPAAVNN
jgi:hypothetical protein